MSTRHLYHASAVGGGVVVVGLALATGRLYYASADGSGVVGLVFAAVRGGVVGLVFAGGGGVVGLYVPVYYASAVGGDVVGLAFAARRLYYALAVGSGVCREVSLCIGGWKWCCKVGVCGG
jgi:hypothetical protein